MTIKNTGVEQHRIVEPKLNGEPHVTMVFTQVDGNLVYAGVCDAQGTPMSGEISQLALPSNPQASNQIAIYTVAAMGTLAPSIKS